MPATPHFDTRAPTRLRGGLGESLLVLASLFALCCALEAGARVFRAFDGPRPTKQDLGKQFEYDPLLGWRKRASFRMRLHQWEYSVDLATNSHGLRDPERPYQAPDGTFRILALGDSFVEAYCVSLEDQMTQALERQLRQAGVSAEVLNGGTAGYSTDQEYLFYESEGLRYGPKVVLLFFYYNDVLYNGQNRAFGRPKPLLVPQDDGSLRPARYPVRRLSHEAQEDEQVDAPGDPRGSAFLGWLQDRLRFGDRRLYNRFTWLWRPLPAIKGVPLEMRVYERQPVEPLESAWTETEMILSALARDAQRRGLPFLTVYVPSRMEVDDATWARTKELYNLSDRNFDRQRVRDRLAKIGKDGGFPVLDLTGPLRAAGPASYYRIDEHWTALGQLTAARAVGRELQARRWLSERGSAGGYAP